MSGISRQLALVLLCFLSAPAFCDPAEELVSAFLSVVGAEDFESAASFYDPADLRDFRESLKFVEEDEQLMIALYEPFFGENTSVGSIRTMSDVQFFAPFLKVIVDDEEMFRVDWESFKVVGSIREDHGLIHVLTRHTVRVAGEKVDTILVTQVVDSGNQPRIKVAPEVAAIPIMFATYPEVTN